MGIKLTRLLSRRKTAAQWQVSNEILLDGEFGVVQDTSPRMFKIGDGATPWNTLKFSGIDPALLESLKSEILGGAPDAGNTLKKLFTLASKINGYLTGVAQTSSTINLDFKEKYNWFLERDTGFTVNLATADFGDNGVKYLVIRNSNSNTAIAISVVFNGSLVNIRGTAMRIYAQGYGEISFKLEVGANNTPFISVMFNSQEIDTNSVAT